MKRTRIAATVLMIMMILSVFLMTACTAVNEGVDGSAKPTMAVSQTPDGDNAGQESSFVFEKIEGGYELKAYNGNEEAPNIPEEYLGEPVVAVGKGAFAGNDTLVQIWFPTNITSIGEGAFENCTALTNAMIPCTIYYIGDNAFAGCENLSIACEAGAEDSMFWSASWNPDAVPVNWESSQGLEGFTFELVKDLGVSILKACGTSAGKVVANTIMSELGFGDELDPRYTEELKKVRDELTKLNEQVEQIDKRLDTIEREVLLSADRTELSTRMTTINQYTSKINTLYDRYLEMANSDDPAVRKSYAKKLSTDIENADIPAMLNYINAELTENSGGTQEPILTLYNSFLEKAYPFKHESGELVRIFYEYISEIQTKGVILHTAYCNYQQKNEPEDAKMYENENEQLLNKAEGYLEKQSEIIPQEDDYKVIVDTLDVSGKEYPIYRMITNNNGATLYLMDHTLPADNTIVVQSRKKIMVVDPEDDRYMTEDETYILKVSSTLVKHLARTDIKTLKNFFAVKAAYGDDNIKNFDYLIHHLPQANLKSVRCNNAGPFALVSDQPENDQYIPGVLLNNLDKGLVAYNDGINDIMSGCDTLILWTNDENRPQKDRLVMYYERTGR